MQFLERLHLSMWVIQTTCSWAEVSNLVFRSSECFLILAGAAWRYRVSTGEEFKLEYKGEDSNTEVVSWIGTSSVGRRGTWLRTFWRLKWFKPVLDHPLRMFFIIKAFGRPATNAVSYSSFCICGISVQMNSLSSYVT